MRILEENKPNSPALPATREERGADDIICCFCEKEREKERKREREKENMCVFGISNVLTK